MCELRMFLAEMCYDGGGSEDIINGRKGIHEHSCSKHSPELSMDIQYISQNTDKLRGQ